MASFRPPQFASPIRSRRSGPPQQGGLGVGGKALVRQALRVDAGGPPSCYGKRRSIEQHSHNTDCGRSSQHFQKGVALNVKLLP